MYFGHLFLCFSKVFLISFCCFFLPVNNGDYIQAILDRCTAENISRLLYPNSDNTFENREIRLKQEYFLCAASLCDIIRRYKATKSAYRKDSGADFTRFAEQNAIQLNDSQSALIIPELMRILVDIEKLEWDHAWKITTKTCAYTNHNTLPEALEKWPIALIEKLLPRHMEIMLKINLQHLERAKKFYAPDFTKAYSLSCIHDPSMKHIDMTYLAIIGCHAVNGVSKIHSNQLKTKTFKEFYEMEPEKFQNKTNGVTPRRWLFLCNPALSNIISEKIGDKWPNHLDKLERLKKLSKDHDFQRSIAKAKLDNKEKMAEYVDKVYGITINPSSLYDVQVQRIHEYKRQLLNCLHLITIYNRIKRQPDFVMPQRTVLIGGKAEPGYYDAKQIIKLICAISSVINNDPAIGDRLKVIFMADYSVALAEQIIPCADLSEQISTAGFEASGTSNMKFMMNGALTIGTFCGANAEIAEEVEKENMFLFGMTANEIDALKLKGYNPMDYYNKNSELKLCIDLINDGYFSPRNPNEFKGIVDSWLKEDKYFVLADYEDYIRAHNVVNETFEVNFISLLINLVSNSNAFAMF